MQLKKKQEMLKKILKKAMIKNRKLLYKNVKFKIDSFIIEKNI